MNTAEAKRLLRGTTSLRLSSAWLVSENVREIREREEAKYVVLVSESFARHLQETVILRDFKGKR